MINFALEYSYDIYIWSDVCVTGEEKLDLMVCDDLNFLKREGIGGEKRTSM